MKLLLLLMLMLLFRRPTRSCSPILRPTLLPSPSPHRKRSPFPRRNTRQADSRWGIGVNRRAVHHHRVIAWNVNDLWIGLLDDDHLFAFHYLCFYLHLLIRFQVALFLRLRAHALDGIHYVILLRQECVAEFGRPLNVVHQDA